ncbi:hypothetical protein L6164_019938 [Bauhinia variegata]|uniref:Uncharacterized protein n=1 Tax=Bauhinia variegata TaxID=167791 RepID=A0ACB9MVE8_BAUVA|nr:hypothetical protein L6164_019938 [Bauhinia variegata]
MNGPERSTKAQNLKPRISKTSEGPRTPTRGLLLDAKFAAKTIMATRWRSIAGHFKAVTNGCWDSSFLLRFQYASYHTIQAIPRECTGSRVSARDRLQDRIPAVVFHQNILKKDPGVRSPSRKQLITTEWKQIKAILKSVELPFIYSTRFPLQIRAGSGSSHLLESGNVLPIKVHRDKESGKILNMVFVWAEDGQELKVDVPVVFKGEDACPGLLKGGYLNRIRTSLRYLSPAEHIPTKIEVDVSNLDVGDRVFMRDIELHPSLKLLSKNENMPICKIVPTSVRNQEPAE